jgi:hypothetical protein
MFFPIHHLQLSWDSTIHNFSKWEINNEETNKHKTLETLLTTNNDDDNNDDDNNSNNNNESDISDTSISQ